MRSIEITSKTREDAIQDALEQLGAERHEVHVEILDEGSAGFFGLGARDVRVSVSYEGDEEPERAEPSAPRGRSRGDQPRAKSTKADPPSERPKRAEKPRRKAEPKRPAQRKAEPKPPAQRKAADPADDARGVEAAALLEEVIRLMGMEATVSSQVSGENGIGVAVDSPDSAILIGRKGRNLDAMQYVLNRAMQRDEDGENLERIVIDIEGYRDRRRASLEDMAYRMGGRVKDSRRRIRLKPLNPQERRVIHVTLQDDPDLRTFSVGHSNVRSIVIAPADERNEDDRPKRRRRSRRGGQARVPAASESESNPREDADGNRAPSSRDESGNS